MTIIVNGLFRDGPATASGREPDPEVPGRSTSGCDPDPEGSGRSSS